MNCYMVIDIFSESLDYEGCYSTDGVNEALYKPTSGLTVCSCISYCRDLNVGYMYAAAKGG